MVTQNRAYMYGFKFVSVVDDSRATNKI